MQVALVACVCVLVFVAGTPVQVGPRVHQPAMRAMLHHRAVAPREWVRVTRAPQNEQMDFVVALAQTGTDALEELFWKVSDPRHEQYGAYVSVDELNALVAASPATMARVGAWLHAHSITTKWHADAVRCTGRVSDVEALLDTELHVFRHAATGARLVRQWGAYSVPGELRDDVVLVEGVANFPVPRVTRRAVRVGEEEEESTSFDFVVPATLKAMYAAGGSGSNKVSHGAIEFQDDASFKPSDLAAFFKQVDEPAITVDRSHIVGPFHSLFPDAESSLDVQYLGAMGGKDSVNYFWTEKLWMYSFAQRASSMQVVPMVVSLSWGWVETGQCQIDQDNCSQLGVDSAQYIARVNTEFMKLGVRGVTIVVASGDAGANSRTNEQCSANPPLNPDFPASSPYVTTVGGSQLGAHTTDMSPGSTPPACHGDIKCAASGDEVACSMHTNAGITSGGGFSNVAAQPAYQSAAVAAYLKSGVALPPAKLFNASGRAYPDVSALAHNYLIYLHGGMEGVDGTSAAAPVFAGVLSQINAHLVGKGGKPLGFANPLLYQLPAGAFQDVTEGNNKCTEHACCPYGYEAAPGWDPVTGLGTPNAAAMITHIDALLAQRQHKLRGE